MAIWRRWRPKLQATGQSVGLLSTAVRSDPVCNRKHEPQGHEAPGHYGGKECCGPVQADEDKNHPDGHTHSATMPNPIMACVLA